MSDLRRSRSKVTKFVASDYNFDLLKIRPTIVLLIGYFTHPNNRRLYTLPGICGKMPPFDLHSCLHSVSLFLLPSHDLFSSIFLGNPSLHPVGVESIAEKQGENRSRQVLKRAV